MIPRTIHCCWFGGPKGALVAHCQASWRRMAPGWRVREWDLAALRTAFGTPTLPPTVEELAAAGDWAYVSDWARWRILTEFGGVYFDCDVELVGSLEGLDGFEWCADETHPLKGRTIAPGSGMGLGRGNALARRMAAALARPPARRALLSARLEEEFPELRERGNREVLGVRRLPPDWFSPVGADGRVRRTERTRGIHHYAMSWAPFRLRVARWLNWHRLGWVTAAALALRRTLGGGGAR